VYSLLKIRFSDYIIKEYILKKAVVIIDSRENENSHIVNWLTKKGIPFQIEKLGFGDYSIFVPKNDVLGFYQELQLDYAIERKANLEELSGNLTNDRSRIEDELSRGRGKIDFVIENGSLDKIIMGDYKTQYDKHSFIATILSFKDRYDIGFNFIEKDNSAELIYKLLYYRLRREVKGE